VQVEVHYLHNDTHKILQLLNCPVLAYIRQEPPLGGHTFGRSLQARIYALSRCEPIIRHILVPLDDEARNDAVNSLKPTDRSFRPEQLLRGEYAVLGVAGWETEQQG
jgi:hypothetical protein